MGRTSSWELSGEEDQAVCHRHEDLSFLLIDRYGTLTVTDSAPPGVTLRKTMGRWFYLNEGPLSFGEQRDWSKIEAEMARDCPRKRRQEYLLAVHELPAEKVRPLLLQLQALLPSSVLRVI